MIFGADMITFPKPLFRVDRTMAPERTILFHSPCFDGIASAVLIWDFLETRRSWQAPRLESVNYDQTSGWALRKLEGVVAVVDFLYHPAAEYWADHHTTTFVNDELREQFESSRSLNHMYDPRATSCAKLLWEQLESRFGYRNDRFSDLVSWADRIDSAQYASVEEAVQAPTPALRLNATLVSADVTYCVGLVRGLRDHSIEEIVNRPDVQQKFDSVRALTATGLDRFQTGSSVDENGILTFDVDGDGAIINRYAPYYFHPSARYSVGIVRKGDGARITAMRNPWMDFPSAPLGKICERFGGGGHQRVGAVVLRGKSAGTASSVLRGIVAAIQSDDHFEKGRNGE